MNKYRNLLVALGLLLFCFINYYFIHKEYLELYELQNELINSYKKVAVLMMKDSKNWYSEEDKQLYFENIKNRTEEEIEEKLYSDFLSAKYKKYEKN
ncbi:hypothetical protein [uncultured Fusobacterium sp.]|uniref:hypothetical protein n=1 Tax=uncultured Fusobacterium sp. TaxID=159267 RepID=UPI0015A62416|nr:hypothetical protein [uncultured Fusobacterium sp.]